MRKTKRKGFMSFNSKDFKGFTFRSGPSKQTKSYSSFWDNQVDDIDVDEFLGNDVDKPKGKDVVALAGYKRAISNFVNIVTEQNIPVVFNSKDESYTDGKKVVIGSNLNDKNFDVAVGLALHEGSHIKLSDFNFLKNLEFEIPQEIYVLGESVGVLRHEVISNVKSILNYVEDRRIDYFVFKTSPGYKGYYHSMYDKYFYSKQIDKGLLSSEFRMENIESYMFRIINLHNKNRQLGALKGLKEIHSTIDLSSISRLESSKDAFDVAVKVFNIILNSIDKIEQNNDSENQEETSSDESGSGGEGESISDENLQEAIDNNSINDNSSNDDGSNAVELSDRQKKMLEKAFKKQENFIDGDVKKTKISKKDNNSVKAIEESGATYEQVGEGIENWRNGNTKGTKCLVVRKLTKSLIDTDQFHVCQIYNGDYYDRLDYHGNKRFNFIEEGLRLGSILGKKLKVRGEETSLKYSRKDAGRIDKRLLAECGFGNSNIFSQTFVEKFNKAYLHISVDASGSMGGERWNKAMTSAVAMIKAADMAGNIDVVLSVRTTHSPRMTNTDVPLIMVCYDSRTDKLSKVKSLFKYLNVSGTTPEGLCFQAIMKDLIPGNNNQDSYFINYSDGQPYYGNREIYYCGSEAQRHTNKMVTQMRNQGMKVMSYFIGNDDYNSDREMKAFRTMYGNDASFINTTNMMQVAKTMNDKFLGK